MAVAATMEAEITVTRIGRVAGAEVSGLDLRAPLDDAVRALLWAAFLEHHVLVFRDQTLSADQQAAFSRIWGPLERHVIRLADGRPPPLVQTVANLDAEGRPSERPYTSGNYYWHTDKSYHAVPSLLTMLHAVELPPAGGDTEFANTALAHDSLPSALREEIAGLTAIHSWEASRRNTGQRPATEEEKQERPPVRHPLVRTHPDSGRKALYVGCHVSHIEGVPPARATALLRQLNAHATQRRFVHAHRWRPGDLVLWDNRLLLHRAVANFEMGRHRRILRRTVVRGTVPV